tara:strand:- start:2222 stop:3190 length:969 start_codon:yes stop_codon:yes gene_type:complete
MAYALTQDDIDRLGIPNAKAGDIANPADRALLGLEPDAETLSLQTPVSATAAAPMASNQQALMGLLETPIPQDPFENLSRGQRTMMGFAALKDAGFALQGKEGTAVRGMMDDITNRADMERKRQAALARNQMMGSLFGNEAGGGLGGREAILRAMAQGLIDGPTGQAMLGEVERKVGVELEISKGNALIGRIDQLIKDPNLSAALGIEGFFRKPLAELGLDADAARVRARVDQIRGDAFLQSFQALKGAGSITEMEGTKAEQAQTRLSQAQKPEDFIEALREFQFYIDLNNRRKAGEQIPLETYYKPEGSNMSDPLGIRKGE